MSTVLEELRALGLEAEADSLGVTVRELTPGALSDEVLASLRQRRAEIHAALLEARRLAPTTPRGAATCADCGQPSGSAMRCRRCASLRVPIPPGWTRCESCGGGAPAGRPCPACAASAIAAEAWAAREAS